ncbi:hypothetical protein [Desulfotomaculum nigrificans]|nr:hypothetical protein [Desulfotomaculum nigrificans]
MAYGGDFKKILTRFPFGNTFHMVLMIGYYTGCRIGEVTGCYKEIQQNLGQQGKTISKSTIAAALRFLQDQGYLVVQAAPLQGMKVKVSRWQRYQAREEEASFEELEAEESQLPGTVTVPTESPPGTPTVPEPSPTGTLGVPAKAPVGTATVPAWYSESTSTGTPTVPVTAHEANNGAAYGTPKNIGKNTKEYGYKNPPPIPPQNQYG